MAVGPRVNDNLPGNTENCTIGLAVVNLVFKLLHIPRVVGFHWPTVPVRYELGYEGLLWPFNGAGHFEQRTG